MTNQAVSKWESSQCCPDISLIPEIADYFGVTTDELFGHDVKEDEPADAVVAVRKTLGALSGKEAYECALKLAFVTHASLISRLMADEGNPGFDPESAIDHAERWRVGYVLGRHAGDINRDEWRDGDFLGQQISFHL